MIELRDCQSDVISRTRQALRRTRAVLIQAPCGFGKTVLTAHMIGTAYKKGHSAWFVCHRRELIKQSMKAFDKQGIPYGVCAADFRGNVSASVQIASVQTLARRFKRYPPPKLIVFDECHHMGAASWRELYLQFPDAKIIGLSATPARLDGQGMGEFFGEMVCGPQPKWLIENGFLSPYRLFAPPTIDTSAFHSRMGDYVQKEVVAAVDKPAITGSALSHYQQYASGKRAAAFCVSIEHSQHVAAEFRAAGIPAVHLDGCADPIMRDGVLADFAAGRIKVLSSVDLLIEGFDLPGIECAILLRPTQSLNIYIQQVGRAMRMADGKAECIILDHAGNSDRFGYPDDDREWTLAGRTIRHKDEDAEPSNRQCGSCFANTPMPAFKCRNCGTEFPIKPRKIEQRDGELEEKRATELTQEQKELIAAKKKARIEQGLTQDEDSLVQLGRMRGMRDPIGWARHVMEARNRKKARAAA